MRREDLFVGVFVGGASSRMGSPKGLLSAPGSNETLVARLVRVASAVVPLERVVLVGRRPEYAHLPLGVVPDAESDAGPLAGLVGLLRLARAGAARDVIAVGCDLPFVEESLLRRLAMEAPEATALAPRPGRFWEPLCARYSASLLEAAEEALAGGRRSLQRFLDETGAAPLVIAESELAQLVDWDTPEDVAERGSRHHRGSSTQRS